VRPDRAFHRTSRYVSSVRQSVQAAEPRYGVRITHNF
jgi:hypothetical protein